jgi:hypothetical protein
MGYRRWTVATGLVLVTGLLVTGCGGGDDDSGSGGGGSTSTSSTTLVAADPASTRLAEDGQLTAADLGAGWTEYAAAEEPKPYTEKCADLRSHAASIPGGTKTKGAILQYGTQPVFVQSDVLVFEDEAAAQAFVEDRLSQEYLECFRDLLDEQQKSSDKNLKVSISEDDDPDVGTGGLEGTTLYTVTDANDAEVAHLYRSVWRYGRVVILVGIDLGQSSDPNLGTAAGDAVSNALAHARDRIQAQP